MKTETKIKLSPKQKEVIRLMREGWELFSWWDDYTNSRWWQLDNRSIWGVQQKYSKRINSMSIRGLRKKRIIIPMQLLVSDGSYTLTELGKTIDIN